MGFEVFAVAVKLPRHRLWLQEVNVPNHQPGTSPPANHLYAAGFYALKQRPIPVYN